MTTTEQIAAHHAHIAAVLAYQEARRNAERAYREAVAPVLRARDDAMYAAADAYTAATGYPCPDPEWQAPK